MTGRARAVVAVASVLAVAVCGLGPVSAHASATRSIATASSTAVVQVAAGGRHTCALVADGTVRCWGQGAFGQLGYANTNSVGNGSGPSIAQAGAVAVGGPVTQIAAGFFHTCALLVDGTVRCWGQGGSGQLGYANTNTIGDNETPASAGAVELGGTAIQVTAGDRHTCALLADGTVRCWGYGGEGRLGYANTLTIGDNETPASAGAVPVGGTVAGISAGGLHTCALLVGGSVRCWGQGSFGQLGYGSTINIGDNETPAFAGDVPVGAAATQISAGYLHTCAVLVSQKVRCWGWASSGALGYGSTVAIGDGAGPSIVQAGDVPVGGAVTRISSGGNHTCALLVVGSVRCWGQGSYGQLGYGNTLAIGDGAGPSIVQAGDVPVGSAVTQLATGYVHTCASAADGTVRCWGQGAYGQLGYGSSSNVGDGRGPSIGQIGAVLVSPPGAPDGVDAVAGNAAATVSWLPPASTGGGTVSGYTTTASPGSRSCTTSGALSCTVTGLTNGTSYTFRVTATNAAGTSLPSAASTPVTPGTPGAPAGVGAVPGNKRIDVSWTAPLSSGAAPLIGYTATANPGAHVCSTTGTTACRISGLDHGATYVVTVVAKNVFGAGPAAPGVTVTVPLWRPTPPRSVTGVARDRSVAVAWLAPLDDGGSPITRYVARAVGTTFTCATTGARSCTVKGLTNGVAYTFQVRAYNSVGGSGLSAASASVTPVGTAIAPATRAGDGNRTRVLSLGS